MALARCRVGAFHILGVNDHKRGAAVTPLSGAGRANLRFSMPAPRLRAEALT